MQERKEHLPVTLNLRGAKFQVAQWGKKQIASVQFAAGADATPLLQGLANDKCHCVHPGYVLKGAIHVRCTDGTEEITRAGELLYWPEGHMVWVHEDTSFVEFSPKQGLKEIYDHIGRKVSTAA